MANLDVLLRARLPSLLVLLMDDFLDGFEPGFVLCSPLLDVVSLGFEPLVALVERRVRLLLPGLSGLREGISS